MTYNPYVNRGARSKDIFLTTVKPYAKNDHCKTCKYRSRKTPGAFYAGGCNYLAITGHSRLLEVGTVKDCPGFPGRRVNVHPKPEKIHVGATTQKWEDKMAMRKKCQQMLKEAEHDRDQRTD